MLNVDDDAPRDAWKKWCLGIAFPSLVAAYGVSCILLQRGTLLGQELQTIRLSGKDAIAFGIAILALALFLHAHRRNRLHHRFRSRANSQPGLSPPIQFTVGILAI